MTKYDENYASAYGLKYKDWTRLEWKPYYPNNILSNGLEGYDCIIIPSAGFYRRYSIRFQFETDVTGLINTKKAPELFILFEGGRFVYACPSLDFAKQRAYTQYAHIFGYVASHIEKTELLTKIHPEDLIGHWRGQGEWKDGIGKLGMEHIFLLPDGTGVLRPNIRNEYVLWKTEDDVLLVWNDGGYHLDYCGAVTLEKDWAGNDCLTLNGLTYHQQMPSAEQDPVAFLTSAIDDISNPWRHR